jgi:nucleoside-diphosphate kinase
MKEQSLVIIKPDAVKSKLVGKIVSTYEENGLRIEEMYSIVPSQEILEKHYAEHIGRDFYKPLLEFMASGTVVVMIVSGENAVEIVREINGATNPAKARPCTLRYKYGTNVQKNVVHGAATLEDAEREIDIWFSKA